MARKRSSAARIRKLAARAAWLALLVLLLMLAIGYARRNPQDLPWRPLDLTEPVGMFTGRKLAALTDDAPRCTALLREAGVRFAELAPVSAGRCGYADGVRLGPGGSRRIGLRPAGVGTSCAVAAVVSTRPPPACPR